MNLKNIYKDLAVLIILVMMTVAAVGMISGKVIDVMKNRGIIQEIDGAESAVDWKKEYPFDTASGYKEIEPSEENSEESAGENGSGMIQTYRSLFDKVKLAVEDSRQFVPFYTRFLELSGRIDRIAGRTEFYDRDGVVLLKNGHLSYVEAKKEAETVEASADSIGDLSAWLADEKIPFLYVQVPVKNDEYHNQLPKDVTDYSNDNLDQLLRELDTRNVNYLDLRESIHQQNLDIYDMFYTTDHHWNVKTGLWAAGEIADGLNERFAFDLDTSIVDIENYEEKTYENWFLGSWGRKVTLGYADPEDFSVFIPKFATNIRMENPDEEMDLTGNFEDVIFDYGILDVCDYYNNNSYGAILYGNRPLTKITNYNCTEGKRVLIIRDSFALAVAPYFSLMCQYTDWMDVREEHGNFNGSVKTYIKETKPDAVILMYNPEGYEFE